MRILKLLAAYLAVAIICSDVASRQQRTEPRAVLYEAARVIAGDGGMPIERGAFAVAHERITPFHRTNM
jgi:hypothetical protein